LERTKKLNAFKIKKYLTQIFNLLLDDMFNA